MTTRDMYNNVKATQSLAPAARVTGVFNGTAADLRGYEAAVVMISFGAYTDGTHTPSLQESSDGSTYTPVASTSMQGSLSAVNSAGGANTIQTVGYIGACRYIRVVMTVTGATTGALTSASIVGGRPQSAPVA